MMVVRLSALRTGRLYPPGHIPGTHFCYRLTQPQGHSVTGRNVSMKNSNDNIGNRTRACSAVPQQTAPPRTPLISVGHINYYVDATVKIDSGLCKSFQGNRFTVSRVFTVFNWKYDGGVNKSTGQPTIKSM
jgi:hypothetical protein